MNWMVFISEQWLLISILSVLVAALIFVEGQRGGKSLSFHEITRMVNQDTAIILDIRDSKDFKAGHITNAINIPFAKLKDRLTELDKYKNKTVVVVCKMGQTAGAASKMLKEAGYNANKLSGGMTEWTSQNLPVIKG